MIKNKKKSLVAIGIVATMALVAILTVAQNNNFAIHTINQGRITENDTAQNAGVLTSIKSLFSTSILAISDKSLAIELSTQVYGGTYDGGPGCEQLVSALSPDGNDIWWLINPGDIYYFDVDLSQCPDEFFNFIYYGYTTNKLTTEESTRSDFITFNDNIVFLAENLNSGSEYVSSGKKNDVQRVYANEVPTLMRMYVENTGKKVKRIRLTFQKL